MPSPEFTKGAPRIATQAVADPALDADTGGQVAVSVSDLVQVSSLVSVEADTVAGTNAVAVDAYSISGNTITLDLETAGTDAADAEVDELIVTARGV